MKTRSKVFLIVGVILAIFTTVTITDWSNQGKPFWHKEQVKTDTIAAPVMVDANLYEVVIEVADSLQTEYSIFVYATDKYDASRIGEVHYLSKEPLGSSIRIILITPMNKPFKCPESIIQKEPTSAEKPISYLHNKRDISIEYAKGPKSTGKKGKGGCIYQYT
jgi:hypothetical protein